MNSATANSTASIGSLQPDSDAHFIELRSVVKKYQTPAGEFTALKGINLQVARGEFVAVLGKSGAGKSTMINLMTGIDNPTSGEILIDRLPIHTLPEDQRAQWRGRNLGMVFQFFQLLPSLTLIENITLSMDFLNTYPRRERKARALHLLEQVGIIEHAYKIPSRISGGQQQRVAIARALANDPAILVADEPTGNLDSHTAHEIFDLFSSLLEHGKTLLVVTHDKEIAARANRRIEMIDGEIVANGSVH
ncbi:MAG TPA: ABC transporter ATP-binding protein [Anaerolineae bacterium]|nr:ABC transporter ATP-binding protein [Anaerolineae bacterium]